MISTLTGVALKRPNSTKLQSFCVISFFLGRFCRLLRIERSEAAKGLQKINFFCLFSMSADKESYKNYFFFSSKSNRNAKNDWFYAPNNQMFVTNTAFILTFMHTYNEKCAKEQPICT